MIETEIPEDKIIIALNACSGWRFTALKEYKRKTKKDKKKKKKKKEYFDWK